MKRLLQILGVIGITLTGVSSVISCVSISLNNQKINLNSLYSLDSVNVYVDDNHNVEQKNIAEIIEYVMAQVEQRILKESPEAKLYTDFTTNAADVIKLMIFQ
ncbi:lipoprotein [Spiroplasma endosymbiont of Labia minor]|uniref:lipoprotein n=1 Tax=Spiroplasma endosymbiont of Labia minor TaxID=3066305 RepID=UPI0030D59D8D